MTIVFEDPPTDTVRARWRDRLEPLKQRPRRWARVYISPDYEKARSYAWQLTNEDRYALPKGRFEFKATRLEDGRGAVYARYLGPEEP
jgi:hypothetical protein